MHDFKNGPLKQAKYSLKLKEAASFFGAASLSLFQIK